MGGGRGGLAPRSWGIAVVRDAAERLARFPAPPLYQTIREQNPGGVPRIAEWDGLAWATVLSLAPGAFINARDKGMVSGGSASGNTTALQSALNDAAPTFGTVYIPAGTYDFDGLVSIPSAVSLVGDGMDITVLRFTPTSGNAIEALGAAGLKHRFADFTLTAATTNPDDGMTLTGCHYSVFTRIRILQFASGLALTDSHYSSFRTCSFDHCLQDGVTLQRDSNVLQFVNCAFTDNGRAGAFLTGSRGVLFSGCGFESNSKGVFVTATTGDNTANTTVEGCYFEANAVNDVLVKSFGGGIVPKNTVVRDSYFQPLTTNTVDSIKIEDHDGVVIEACTFDNLSGFSYAHSVNQTVAGSHPIRMSANVDRSTSGFVSSAGLLLIDGSAVSGDRGDAGATLTYNVDAPEQRWDTTLTANRTVVLSGTGARNGARFRVTRTGLGAFTLDVGGLKTIPAGTAASVEVIYDGAAWKLAAYGVL